MREATEEQRKQYREFRNRLPRSPGVHPEVYWPRKIAEAVFEREAQDKWIDLKTLHQLCLDADLHDAGGPVKLESLKQLLALMFRRGDFVFFDIYEIHKAHIDRKSEDGHLGSEPVYYFEHHDKSLLRNYEYLRELKAKLLQEEKLENASLPVKSEHPPTEAARGGEETV